MDIRAWEKRVVHGSDDGQQEGEEEYYNDAGEVMTSDEYEEMLFRRVLDKIRVARAAGNEDVDLSPEELEAYQARLHGPRSPTARSQPKSRNSSAAAANDAASVITTTRSPTAPRVKKSQRNSIFSTKPKKQKSSRKRDSPTLSVAGQVPPGFVVPGQDGQSVYSPINAYEGNLVRDSGPPPRPSPYSAPNSSHQVPTHYHPGPPITGAYPGSDYSYQSSMPPPQPWPGYARQSVSMQGHDASPATSAAQPPPRLIPFPIEPYQYQSFTPPSASPVSPHSQYARRVSLSPSEASTSYTAMPRRVPAPPPTPVQVQRTLPATTAQSEQAPLTVTTQEANPVTITISQDQAQVTGVATVKDGERKRKGGKKKKG